MTRRVLLKQPMMRGVLWALLPAFLWAVHAYGWRAAALVVLTMAASTLAEGAFLWRVNKPVSEAALVTGALLGMSLPPRLPLWMGPVGAVFAIVFGKMVFGGFGMNPFNPAMVGRAFIYLAFPVAMTGGWAQPAVGIPGGMARWSADALTGATPMVAVEQGMAPSHLGLLLGRESGSIGEGARILLILGGLYLLLKKYARWRFVLSTFAGAGCLSTVLWAARVPGAPDPLYVILSGGFVLGAFYMATDPISSPKTMAGAWVYGVLIGAVTVVIRVFGAFAEGMMFAILLGNMAGPVVDWWVTDRTTPEEA